MKTAQKIFDEAFMGTHDDRSPEFKAGVLAHLKYRMLETDEFECPYDDGTAEADAWKAGTEKVFYILELFNNSTDKRREKEKQDKLNKKAK